MGKRTRRAGARVEKSAKQQFAMLQAVVFVNPEKILATLGGKRKRASSLRVPERQSQGLRIDTEGGFLFRFRHNVSSITETL